MAMEKVLGADGVGVMVEARHLCMACRGVRKQRASMVTTALKGKFREAHVKMEFFAQIRGLDVGL